MTTTVQAAEIWSSSTGLRLPDVTRAVAGLVKNDRLPRQRPGGGKANIHLQAEHFAYFGLSMVPVAAGVPIVDTAAVARLLFDTVPIETAGKAKAPILLAGMNLGEGIAALLTDQTDQSAVQIEVIFRGQSYPTVMVTKKPEEPEFYYPLFGGSDLYSKVINAPIPLECIVCLTMKHLAVLRDMLADSNAK